ncbi:MAG: hypothetical protein PW788_02020 [Micavibrio sp.]|nr:hypothetical protein [Micavibrio sp.]
MLVFATLAFIALMAPRPAAAQCEVPGVTNATAAGIAAANTASLNANYLAPVGILPAAWTVSITIVQGTLITALKVFETTLLNRLRKFWEDYLQAMKDQTSELNASLSDGTRQLNSLYDTGNMTSNQRAVQNAEVQAKKQYLPTDAGCRFDTAGAMMGRTTNVSRAVSSGLGGDFNKIGLNTKGSDSAKGPGQLLKARWERYANLFCDKDANGGNAGCTATTPLVNAHVLPGKTLFAQETIPMDDQTMLTMPSGNITKGEAWRLATNELIYNITGYEASAPVPKDALESTVMQDRRAEQRGYATQMDAVGALIYGVIADRVPGCATGHEADCKTAADIHALRIAEGIANPSEHPSDREVRQSVIEQLWDPNYYVDLGDSPSTTSRKELYLSAYNLMLLYKVVEKTEKIANAFAVQTANLLDFAQGDNRYDQQTHNPIR